MIIKSARKGFTLIELLAVMAIIAILAAALVPQIPKFIDRANVTACHANLSELYKNFILYKDRTNDWPDEGGIKFFLTLWHDDPQNHDDSFAKRFTCPGVKPHELPGIYKRKPSEWFDDYDQVDGTFTAYAGRDIEKFRNLDSNPGNQALVGDDNELAMDEKDPRPNHQYTTVVLFADGTPRDFDYVMLRKEGTLGPKQFLIPGPDCPVPELKTLRADAPASKAKRKPAKR